MRRFMSIALCLILAVTAFIMPVSATTAASVVYVVNGNTFATVENLSTGFSYAPDRMAENIPDGKYFAGWQNENGESFLKFHNHVTWNSFVYMQLVDDDGAAIQLKNNTKYFVTVTYKLPRTQGKRCLYAVAGLHLDNRDSITETWQGISQRVGSLIETSDPSIAIASPSWVWT